MSDWSIQHELCKLAKADSLEFALLVLNVIEEHEVLVECQEVESWRQGGAETYIYRFDVVTSSREIPLILKALTPPLGAVSVEKTVEQWNARRLLLASHLVPVPRLFYAGSGVVLEEYIPYDLKHLLKGPQRIESETVLHGLLVDLVRYAKVLDALGFASINPFDDLRSDGRQVFVIDFGHDLGPPDVRMKGNEAEKELKCWVTSQSASLAEVFDVAIKLSDPEIY